MTKKDLFRIIIKVGGLYFLITMIFNALPGMSIFFSNTPALSFVLFIASILAFVAIFLLLIFNPDAVIKALKLDKGFDDEAFSLQRLDFSNIVKITIIILGLSLIIKQLPLFITHLFFLLKLLVKNQHGLSDQMESMVLTDYIGWGIKIISLVIGYLMITNYSSITRFILKKDLEKNTDK